MKDCVELSRSTEKVAIRITGNAGMDEARELQRLLLAEPETLALTVDWSEAEHVESCVLQVLLAYRKQLVRAGQTISIVRDSVHVRGLLEVGGLSEYFPVIDMNEAGHALATADA